MPHFKNFKKYSKHATQSRNKKINHPTTVVATAASQLAVMPPSPSLTSLTSLAVFKAVTVGVTSAVAVAEATSQKHVKWDFSKNLTRMFHRKDCPSSIKRTFAINQDQDAALLNQMIPLKSCLKCC
jgi:hypothetical protein